MRFNRTTQTDEAIKNYAKKKATKAASKVGQKAAKAAGKLTAKIISMLVGAIGLPAFMIICCVMLLFLVLPLSGFVSVGGLDATTTTVETGIDTSAFQGVEESAERALEERARQLSHNAFWDDMLSFFTSGFTNSHEKFETELADAAFLDENGEEELTVYAGSFNRLVAIINESFRASLRDSDVLKLGEEEAERHRDEYIEECEALLTPDNTRYPSTADTTYNIIEQPTVMEIKRDESLDTTDYLFESCYVISASSVNDMLNSLGEGESGYKNSVENALDTAFNITGMGDEGTAREITWQFSVTSRYAENYTEGETRYDYEYINHYYYDGNEISRDMYFGIANSGNINEINKLSSNTETKIKHTYHDIIYQRTVTATYSAYIKDNFKDIVLDELEINEELDDTAPGYEMSIPDLINKQCLEFRKLYSLGGETASLEDMGLPLPSGSYSISSGYGESRGTGRHKGIDLAAAGGTSIYAMEDGVVTDIYWGGGGHTIKVRLESGYYQVCYHMDVSSSNYVSVGDEVKKGDQIGSVGTTFDASMGGSSTGNHLHLEIHNESGVACSLSAENIEAIRAGSTNPDSSKWDQDFI